MNSFMMRDLERLAWMMMGHTCWVIEKIVQGDETDTSWIYLYNSTEEKKKQGEKKAEGKY